MNTISFVKFEDQLSNFLGSCSVIEKLDCESENLKFSSFKWYGLDGFTFSGDINKISKFVNRNAKQGPFIYLVKQLEGKTLITFNNEIESLHPGDIILLDSLKQFDLSFELLPIHILVLCLPRMEFFSWCKYDLQLGATIHCEQNRTKALNAALPQASTCESFANKQPDLIYDLTMVAFRETSGRQLLSQKQDPKTRYQKLLHIIELNLTDHYFCLAKLAEVSNLSKRQIQRDLESEGESFSNILISKRIELAQQKIFRCVQIGSVPNIGRIALASGFGDISNFYRVFKRKCACTPSEFIKNLAVLDKDLSSCN